MSLALSGDTIAYLMGLGLDAGQMKGLIDRLNRDALAMTPPAQSNGINEERERLRNESTYAERKRKKDRERRAFEREELRRLKAEAATTPATPGDYPGEATATEGDQPATPSDPPLAPTHVVVTSLPSLRSEEINPQTPSVSSPRKAKSTSKPARRCPEGWVPTQLTRQVLLGEGFEPGDLERALTKMRDHEFKTPRTDWEASFRNWVREDRERRKPIRPDHANTRSARRGVWAEIAAEERGEGPGLLTGPR